MPIFGHFLAGNGYLGRKWYLFYPKSSQTNLTHNWGGSLSKMIILSRKMYVLQPFPAFQYPFWPFPGRKWLFEQEKRLQKCATFYCMLSTPNQASFDIKTFVNNFAAPLLLYCLHYRLILTSRTILHLGLLYIPCFSLGGIINKTGHSQGHSTVNPSCK